MLDATEEQPAPLQLEVACLGQVLSLAAVDIALGVGVFRAENGTKLWYRHQYMAGTFCGHLVSRRMLETTE